MISTASCSSDPPSLSSWLTFCCWSPCRSVSFLQGSISCWLPGCSRRGSYPVSLAETRRHSALAFAAALAAASRLDDSCLALPATTSTIPCRRGGSAAWRGYFHSASCCSSPCSTAMLLFAGSAGASFSSCLPLMRLVSSSAADLASAVGQRSTLASGSARCLRCGTPFAEDHGSGC